MTTVKGEGDKDEYRTHKDTPAGLNNNYSFTNNAVEVERKSTYQFTQVTVSPSRYDVTGLCEASSRYPWQRDIAIQCDNISPPGCNEISVPTICNGSKNRSPRLSHVHRTYSENSAALIDQCQLSPSCRSQRVRRQCSENYAENRKCGVGGDHVITELDRRYLGQLPASGEVKVAYGDQQPLEDAATCRGNIASRNRHDKVLRRQARLSKQRHNNENSMTILRKARYSRALTLSAAEDSMTSCSSSEELSSIGASSLGRSHPPHTPGCLLPSAHQTSSSSTFKTSRSLSHGYHPCSCSFNSVNSAGSCHTSAPCPIHDNLRSRRDTLPSPVTSPIPWMDPLLPVSPDSRRMDTDNVLVMGGRCQFEDQSNYSHYNDDFSRRGQTRSPDDLEIDSSPTMIRRGRRQAIYDSKGLGLVTAPDGDFSSATSGEETDMNTSSNKEVLSPPEVRKQVKRNSADLVLRRSAIIPSSVDISSTISSFTRIDTNTTTRASGVGENVSPSDMASPQVSPPNVQTSVSKPSVTKPRPHPKKMLVKRNTIADFAVSKGYQASTQSLVSEDTKKIKGSSFSLLKLIDKKSHKVKDTTQLTDVLQGIKLSEFKDHSITTYKDLHWSEVVGGRKNGNAPPTVASITAAVASLPGDENERKRREAVWELFTSECVFLVDHIMVLKHCFMEPLKKVQVEGYLMYAEPLELFGNIDELCYVSYTFCKEFISLLLKDCSDNDFGRTEVVGKALQRLSQLTRDGEVYHDYCLNYSKAINYLEKMRKNDDFCDFEKHCEQDTRCHRLQLTDLLISPMHRCTKVPLLLTKIRKYTKNAEERNHLTEILEKLEESLQSLEVKMKWLKNYERVQEIHQRIIWPSIIEMDPRIYIPEFLKGKLNQQPCERLLTSPKRQLIHEGPITLIEANKAVDMHMFLFDDILLLTRVKKIQRKKMSDPVNARFPSSDGTTYTVHKQPIALDRFTIHDIRPQEATVNTMLKNGFVLVQISRFRQVIGAFTLQNCNESSKILWMTRLREAQETYKSSVERSSSLGTVTELKQLDSFSRSLEVEGGVVSPPAGVAGGVSNDNTPGGIANGHPPQHPPHYPTSPFGQQTNAVSPPPIHQPPHHYRTSIMTTSQVDDEEDNAISLDRQSSHWMAAHMYAVGVPPPVTRQASQSSMRSGSLSSDLGELTSPGRLQSADDTRMSVVDASIAAVHARDKSPGPNSATTMCRNTTTTTGTSSAAPPMPTTSAPLSPKSCTPSSIETSATAPHQPTVYKHPLRQESRHSANLSPGVLEAKISSAPALVTSRRQDSEVNLSPRSRRLHRLLAIHEKSQSMDAIFI